MNLLELFEEEDEIGIKDPKASQTLKQARSKYGWANNDLEAFLAMVQDEQVTQDREIETQFDVNADQEVEIDDNTKKNKNTGNIVKSNVQTNQDQSQQLNSLERRIQDLEQGGYNESKKPSVSKHKKLNESKIIKSAIRLLRLIESNDINWEPQPEFKGVGGVATAYGDSAKRQRTMPNRPDSNRRYQSNQSTQNENINQKWQRALLQLKNLEPQNKKHMVPILQKVAQAAAKRNITLTPDPSKFKFLQ